jgi:hypothetical protein
VGFAVVGLAVVGLAVVGFAVVGLAVVGLPVGVFGDVVLIGGGVVCGVVVVVPGADV